ncbi:hypothetical protein TSAR_015567 [Trichomalopsis sarcophagae]|uniref:Uncharacterized protein n=1 Tax=Trichomalopsis sarcophagae TaxID=543379 RepID=A0A232F493_9HYME|nr:hypothetical protein TSAR_015567 [Trichomalopsis sarcophagae]
MIDTGTVRLVILFGMFLYFAGDYNTVIQSIWGNNGEDANQTDSELKRLPEGPPKNGLHLERMVFAAAKKNMDEEDNDNYLTYIRRQDYEADTQVHTIYHETRQDGDDNQDSLFAETHLRADVYRAPGPAERNGTVAAELNQILSKMQLTKILTILACCFLILNCVVSAPAPQEPFFEIPVQLVGFPVIIAAVRITNFVKKLAYSLNPQTYANRTKRTLPKLYDDEILDVAQVEKRMISELGENVCIYERICSKYAQATLQKKGRERANEWDSIFSGLTRPNFNLFQALSSIARYDDLKCVPRILCEVASGSMPGSLSYRQSSTLQNFGSNALFGLLTAFDSSGTSPILSFGRAALLGYTNRGESSMCYREYSRCPSNPDQLISYLNNHNGGFFRFFQGNQGNPGNYYRPQQSFNRPYYKNSVQYRILQTTTEYPYPQSLLGPEADRTGTGKLTFADSVYDERESNDNRFFAEKLKQSGSSKVVFPREMRLDQAQSNRIIKSLNVFNDLNANKMKNEAYRKDRKFFPQEDEFENEYKDYFSQSQMDYNRKPRFEQHNNKQSYLIKRIKTFAENDDRQG